MANRDFSDSVKLIVITENLRNNNGNICCAICGSKLSSINECHFDHIFPYSKGGKSTADNCQILCVSCNLKKTDKELNDFLLEEKAKKFLEGNFETNNVVANAPKAQNTVIKSNKSSMTKDQFDQCISDFIALKGNIYKVDFGREYNNLPSISYVHKYYGNLTALKKAFGIEDLSANWNRETIRKALYEFVEEKGDILQKDLIKKNNLPSLPCVLNYYPEYKSFTDIKKNMLGLTVRKNWDIESVIQAGKDYVKQHGKITENCMRSENNLPTMKIIYNYFGSLSEYQKVVGSVVSNKNEYISEKEIENAVDEYFGDNERKVESMKAFLSSFPYSSSTISKRYGSFDNFCRKNHIIVLKKKKAKFSKQEVDDAIANWVKTKDYIPASYNLCKLGLPSMSVILKFYEDWKEPFVLYRKLYEKLNK